MITQHTPGPWTARSRSMSDGSLVVKADGPDYTEVCSIAEKGTRTYGTVNDRQIADATLIAAAPDMLEALRELVQGAEFSACTDQNNPALWKLCINARAILARIDGAS